MLNNFIYAKSKDLFESELSNGNVPQDAIAFIEDTKEIYTHGSYFATRPTNISEFDNDIGYITSNTSLLTVSEKLSTPIISANDSIELQVGSYKMNYNGNKLVLYDSSNTEIFSTDSLTGFTSVTSIASIPISKRMVLATISASASFSLAGIPKAGHEIHVIVKNSSTSSITVTLPNSGNYVSLVGTALSIPGSSYAEINVMSDGSKMYIRAL